MPTATRKSTTRRPATSATHAPVNPTRTRSASRLEPRATDGPSMATPVSPVSSTASAERMAVVAAAKAKMPAKAKTAPPQEKQEKAVDAKAQKLAAKRALAVLIVKAVGELTESLNLADPDHSLILDTYSNAECARIASQWIHHLPVGTDWPGTLPKPDRSNWK